LGVKIKKDNRIAIIAKMANIIIGVGFETSATIGANTVALLANMLQIPKTVDARTAG
jgi:hypothetical protein